MQWNVFERFRSLSDVVVTADVWFSSVNDIAETCLTGVIVTAGGGGGGAFFFVVKQIKKKIKTKLKIQVRLIKVVSLFGVH